MFQGLSKEMQTPKDLLAKLHFDFARIKANPLDVYAAFDFFVTAEHIPDWLNDIPIKKRVPLLKVVSHIANGAKHFTVKDTRHKSVKNIHEKKGGFQDRAFQPNAFYVGDLMIELKGDESKLLGSEISVREFAEKVIQYWIAQIT